MRGSLRGRQISKRHRVNNFNGGRYRIIHARGEILLSVQNPDDLKQTTQKTGAQNDCESARAPSDQV